MFILNLAWLKVFVTLGFTDSENFVIMDEHHAVAWVDGPWTEITLLDSHVEPRWDPTYQTPDLRAFSDFLCKCLPFIA
jgi:hypothetical protein